MALVAVRADAGATLVDLAAGVDAVMMVNMGVYTGNSSVEKVALLLARRRNEDPEDDKEDLSVG